MISHEKLDAVIVPGRAFDPSGNRIGRGKGYYDNFLKSTHFQKIAAGYSFQLFDRVPSDSHDIPLDYVVTEETIIKAIKNIVIIKHWDCSECSTTSPSFSHV